MPSFDVVSEVDLHALTNAVDQAERVITNRFDFKGVDCGFERKERTVMLHAEAEFQLQQMMDVLRGAITKCQIDPRAIKEGEVQKSGKTVKQEVTLLHGLDAETSRKLVKLVKDSKLKVQTAIQGEQLRVTGKKRDDLQQVIALLRANDIGVPLQYENFRD
ncbi:MAG TPA: YajQ family cyclic di-GMP-binding protein [Pseudomonadales bacterium]|nr:YajQ family cyclic di-GMP-binding protein [Pseudomonadales bacterium]HNC69688.1 YajQ family cyclic di-GMP-binding protein [Pseudomonadales bacterium]HND13432.1 YajQ family cyclic di-GMP-binding protein [Pseudomonadales bacterium]